jgi:putative oxidoreductase
LMLGSLFGVNVDAASLLMRLTLGIVAIIHGYPKLKEGGKSAGQWLKSIGIPAAFGPFAGVAEFFGGILVLLGLLTPIVAALFVVWWLGTTWLSVAKIKKKFAGGWEIDFILLLLSLALAVVGSGAYSLDLLLGI